MGEGTRIRFSHDRWIGDTTLKDLYPKLYVCSAVKDACISEVLWIPEGGTVRVWNLTFYRAFEDWELAASYSLFQLIQTRIPEGGTVRVWNLTFYDKIVFFLCTLLLQ